MRLLDLKGRYRLEWQPGASLKDLHQMLKPSGAQWIGGGALKGGRPYPMMELLGDLDTLIQRRNGALACHLTQDFRHSRHW